VSVTIRIAQVLDLSALKRIYKSASLSNEGDRAALEAHPQFLEFSDRSVREGRTRVAVSDGQIVGFATFVDAEADDKAGLEVEDLFVDPDQMRRGVATELIGDLARTARDRGHSRLVVIANPHAVPFYQAVGFEQNGLMGTALGPGVRMHLVLAG
jgi:GNAT superfamily N-acetyltransferase